MRDWREIEEQFQEVALTILSDLRTSYLQHEQQARIQGFECPITAKRMADQAEACGQAFHRCDGNPNTWDDVDPCRKEFIFGDLLVQSQKAQDGILQQQELGLFLMAERHFLVAEALHAAALYLGYVYPEPTILPEAAEQVNMEYVKGKWETTTTPKYPLASLMNVEFTISKDGKLKETKKPKKKAKGKKKV